MCAKTVIIITGPTAAGKTELSLAVARHFNTSIISADSRQCFRELNIGVAKPSPEELNLVKHEFINSHGIQEEVNAALFESLSLQWAGEIFKKQDVLVMAGGTGLYLKAFCEGLDPIPPADEQLRIEIREQYQLNGLGWLREKIKRCDPEFYQSGETANPQRMMRALEVMESTGRSILSFRDAPGKTRPFRILRFGIRVPTAILYRRINDRVDRMMELGLLEEVHSLLSFQHLNALQTVGYTELFEYLNGNSDLPEAVRRIKQNSRHYAKRQMTWFRKDPEIRWLEENRLQEILQYFGEA
ncbi:MAG: tRNA (adenosine(37)-N6)-dimethylallyltransferase MiaA [Bacteroidota bacterium]|nr:tRNA (adenosine(37)-N6)-dimethylallyltransferase MiaA [Bacteroidota bacterium]MDP4212084.1 tRNA (adenosine(37)-N6)-dimethylallyltransferase MiaA [Bacteroidota bacterium]MDP4249301.1 tRNA (adenosine(37)-N6)-dimethylallyltransferase MiaA [Bacteroidota bacterium]